MKRHLPVLFLALLLALSACTASLPANTVQTSSVPSASSTAKTSRASIADEPTQSITVYVTETGSKYHSDSCQYLRKSQIAISLADAKSSGYKPCSKCRPPR